MVVLFGRLVVLAALYCFVGLLIGYPIKWLWNYTLPEISKGMIAEITFWHALALFILSNLLFKANVSVTSNKS